MTLFKSYLDNEIEALQNAGPVVPGGTGVVAFTSVNTASGVVLSFDQPGTQIGTDHSLPEGQLLFNVDQRAIVSVDFRVISSNDADGFLRIFVNPTGSLPDLSYVAWGPNLFQQPLLNPGGGAGHYFNITLPETFFSSGSILNWSCQHIGSGTINLLGGGCMLYVLRTA